MPFFGKSLFESVLDELWARDETDTSEMPGACRHGAVPLVFESGFPTGPAPAMHSPYEDFGPPEQQHAKPEWAERCSELQVAEDLNLAACLTRVEINDRRREFARQCHPDIVSPEYRSAAAARMTLANRLIDDEIKRRG